MHYTKGSRKIYLFVGDKSPEFKNKVEALLKERRCKYTYHFVEAKFSVLLKELPLIKYIVREMN